ncbi:hypothetical protein L3Q82_007461 [Scortum barcoo]|uniref:Uncharacterized protein n=1 Tax=Scortum barcoo TaxID=214431 RepID=A0ACB8WPY3_9TELE|nr:hypothetical protein L3Q82_007461 [Scortum barcoo]
MHVSQVSVSLLTCMAKACPSSLAKISSSVLPGVFRLVHSPLLQGGALAAILDFMQALVLSKTSNLGYRHFLQLFRGDPRGVPRPAERDIVSLQRVLGLPRGPPPGGTCLEHLPREASRGHPKQMPKPPQLTPLDAKEQRLYSELLPSDLSFSPYL